MLPEVLHTHVPLAVTEIVPPYVILPSCDKAEMCDVTLKLKAKTIYLGTARRVFESTEVSSRLAIFDIIET